MAIEPGQLVGVSKLARLLDKSENAVRDLERRGIIHAVRDSANRRQFDGDQVAAALRHYGKETSA